jgi:hypothetical protein
MQEQISLEDVMAYMKFVQERAGLSDQEALSQSLEKLAERLDAVILGNAYRTHLHIRDVARRMILSRREPGSEQTMSTIIETLAERVYAHGHAIGLNEARAIGLPVQGAAAELDDVMWRLLNEYEADMHLLEPIDPAKAVSGSGSDVFTEDATIAMIESTWGVHEFRGQIEARARRQMPPTLQVSLNLNLQLPAGIDPAQLPQQIQQVLQQMAQQVQNALLQSAQQAVQAALAQQAPVLGVEASFKGPAWSKTG